MDDSTNAETLETLYREGVAAWPAITCSRRQFRLIAECSEARDLRAANGTDIYIAAAVVAGNPAAISAFESIYIDRQRARLRQLGLCPASVEDVLQTIRERLLMPRAERTKPQLAHLAGCGNFHTLIRVIAVRTGLNVLRSQGRRRRNEDDAAVEMLSSSEGALRVLMRAEAAHLLREAIERAVSGLSPKNRTLLRLHFSHGMSIDEIGRMYNVHRATAARWLCRVREIIETEVKANLQQQHGQATTNLEELLGLASSQLQVSFDRILATTNRAAVA